MKKESTIQRRKSKHGNHLPFFERKIIDPKTGCWNWIGMMYRGYGHVCIEGKVLRAHRVALSMKLGISVDQIDKACHRCDNKACINPDHLFHGTQAENIADMMNKGREARGIRNGLSKLTDDQVERAKLMRQAGRTCRSIAHEFGVSHSTISVATRGITWKHLDQK